MKTRKAYTYSILRYAHDPSSGEFINIGVAVFSEEQRFFNIKIRQTLGRISETFPDVRSKSLRGLFKAIQNRFDKLAKAYNSPLSFDEKHNSLENLIYSVLPKDDSSLVWSQISSGVSDDPSKVLDNLYQRYVSKYDSKKLDVRKTDSDLVKDFRKELQDRSILKFFDEKVISTDDDQVKFPFAWKNGIWHCIEPISFDLSAPEYIREKAHRYLGQMTSANSSKEEFKVYLLLSKPSNAALTTAFEKALGILKKMPMNSEVYLENDKDVLLQKLSEQIHAHP